MGRSELAAAVSYASGLGILTALTQPRPDDLRRVIVCCRTTIDRPFGVCLKILPSVNPPQYAEYRRAIVVSGITIVETAGGKDQPSWMACADDRFVVFAQDQPISDDPYGVDLGRHFFGDYAGNGVDYVLSIHGRVANCFT